MSADMDNIGMVGMVAGNRADAVSTQEFILVEHPRQDPTQPLGVHERKNAAICHPAMTRPGRMNTLEKFRHASQTLLEHRYDIRYPLPLPGLDDGGGTEGEQTHHGADLETCRLSIGMAQDVVVK